jgi:arylsulfatase A-like enzyme
LAIAMALEVKTVRNFLQCVALVALLAACSGNDEPQGGGQAKPPNVLLVVVDTLRADHLGIYGYDTAPTSPFLDELSQESLVVDGLTGVTSWTMPSMASLFTGKLPSEHRVMRMVGEGSSLSDAQTLAARFRAGGYATACMMSNFLLVKGKGFNEGFDLYDDGYARLANPHRGSTAADVAGGGIQWLQKQDGDKPWFLNLHFFDPHTSYEDHPEWQFTDPSYSGWVRGGLDDEDYKLHQDTASVADRKQLAALYDEEIRTVDEAIRSVVIELKRRNQWDNTIVIFTSDHGEELAERGYIGHTRTLFAEQIDLPLLVRLPADHSVRGRRAGLLGQARLYNTILDLAGLPINAAAQPSAANWLLSNEANPPQQHAFFEVDFRPYKTDPSRRIRKRGVQLASGYKFIRDLKTGDEAFYNLKNDPGERTNQLHEQGYRAEIDRAVKLLAAHPWY